MRGLETGKARIRHQVFTAIARMAYEGGDYAQTLERLPYDISPGEIAEYRDSVFTERAVVGERLRLALGLDARKYSTYHRLSAHLDEAVVAEKYYNPPLINVIKFACNKCPDNVITVTDACQGCLEHPCMEVCPKNAITRQHGRAVIDQSLCIKCGKCTSACSFGAILRMERPCSKACGVKCIGSDSLGRADIDYTKCTSCGQCLVACPFGAIADKSQIFQTVLATREEAPVFVALAPAFVGQFGPAGKPEKMKAAFRRLGFADVYEVAVGADLCVMEEAEDFLKEVPAKHKFMVTSCCPSWADMVRKMFPEFTANISVALTPMVLTARMIKKQHPGCKVVFVGPCDSKKLEASRKNVRSDVDFVLTFEEVLGMFEARGVEMSSIPAEEEEPLSSAGGDARNFAVAGGVAQAVVNAIHSIDPTREVKVARADGLEECRKLLLMAKAGKFDGYLLEGMACPGGCVAGAGTLQPVEKSKKAVASFADAAAYACATETDYKEFLPLIRE